MHENKERTKIFIIVLGNVEQSLVGRAGSASNNEYDQDMLAHAFFYKIFPCFPFNVKVGLCWRDWEIIGILVLHVKTRVIRAPASQ